MLKNTLNPRPQSLLLKVCCLLFLLSAFACGDSSSTKEPESGNIPTEETDSNESESNPEIATSSMLKEMGIQTSPGEMPAYKTTEVFKERTYRDPVAPLVFDLNLNISGYSLHQLNYLRNYLYAIKGKMFMDAADRSWFANEDWYQPNYWEDGFEPTFSAEETAFLGTVENAIAKKQEGIFTYENGNWVEEGNIINLNQIQEEKWEQIKSKVLQNGMAIVPAKHEQLWFPYDGNNYQTLPSFVTSDLFLQVFHMYFSYLLRDLEEDSFMPALKKLTKAMHKTNQEAVNTADSDLEKNAREFNQFYFGLAYDLLTGEKLTVPASYEEEYTSTRKKIKEAAGKGNKLLNAPFFDYSLFKARGHYTRNEDLKKYFKAMMWLQIAPLNVKNQVAFNAAILSANDLDRDNNLEQLYYSIYEPIVFIVGQPNKLSVLDVQKSMAAAGYGGDKGIMMDNEAMEAMRLDLKERDPAKFKTITANETTEEAINKLAVFFLPQRYTFDAEILSRLVDIKREDLNEPPKRPVPKGLDVFAGLGNGLARDILLNYYKENEKWPAYGDSLSQVMADFKQFDDWDENVYNKWMKTIDLLSIADNRRQQPFKTPAWEKKCLNTTLASWAELKHDVILYADQPNAAQMGGGGPDWPEPYVRGYVEPNLQFWQSSVDLVKQTKSVLNKYNLNQGTVKSKTESIEDLATTLRDIAQKELEGTDLSRDDQDYIQYIGGLVERLTMSIMEPEVGSWYEIEGPDKFIAVVADVYTYAGENKKVVLEEATGYGNDIYVTVEQDGKLYLCRGTVLSYYEFEQPMNNRLTDEQWQEKVKSGDIPPVPGWVEEIMVAE